MSRCGPDGVLCIMCTVNLATHTPDLPILCVFIATVLVNECIPSATPMYMLYIYQAAT